MKKIYLFIAVLFTVNVGNSQVIFSEDFQQGIPATWTLINADGLTPSANVAYVTDAWIGREDIVVNASDSVAISTSWYSPAGASDDWLITPAINITANNLLKWEANAPDAAYPDGYEVRISTTTPTTAGFLANPALLTIAAENSTWTNRTLDLEAAGYSNQTVYLAWRNTSFDKFILMVDSVIVEVATTYDVAISDPAPQEYTIIPLPQVSAIGTNGLIKNVGASTVTNATMTVNVYDGAMANIYTASSTPATILAGDSIVANVAGYIPTLPDNYMVEMITSITEADAVATNDTLRYALSVSDSVYARDDSNISIALGINGTGNFGELGQQYTITTPDELTSVSAFINGNLTHYGKPLYCKIYEVTNGTIGTLISTTDTIAMDSVPFFYTLPISGGSLMVSDTFAIMAIEDTLVNNLALGGSNNIFTPNTAWASINGGAFATIESLGFNISFVLRANFGDFCATTTSSITEVACNSYTAPSGAVYTSSSTFNDTISNMGGCDSIITINLTINNPVTSIDTQIACDSYDWIDGNNYSISNTTATHTIPNGAANGCDSIVTLNLTINSAVTSTDTQTACNNYDWIDGNNYSTSNTTATHTIPNGAANGCDSIVTLNLTINTVNTTVSVSNDTLTADLSGATSYQWIDCNNGNSFIPSATNQAYTATTNGDYAVIITDNGCTDTSACNNVVITSIDNQSSFGKNISIFPNPSEGIFTVSFKNITTSNLTIEVLDITGKVIIKNIVANVTPALSFPINISNVGSGTYFIRISNKEVNKTSRISILK
jgi:hypothetical protein